MHMAALKLSRDKIIFSLTLFVILALISFNYYNSNNLKNQISAMSTKLEQNEQDYNQKIKSLESDVDNSLNALGSNIKSLDTNIKTIDTKTESIKVDVKETK